MSQAAGSRTDFRLLLGGQTVSLAGSFVSVIALPLTALTVLDASTFEVGLLTALGFVGYLIAGLPAGVLVDRVRRRPLMLWCDVARAVVLLSIPIAHWAGGLSLWYLAVATLVQSLASVAFEIAYQAYLPSIVTEDELVASNAKLEGTATTAAIAGPTLGGFLVQVLTAPTALLIDAGSFVVSFLSLAAIRGREDPPAAPATDEVGSGAAIAAGLGVVARDPFLRSVTACTTWLNLFEGAFDALAIVFLVREVGAAGGAIGVLFSVAGIGGILGATLAARLAARWGSGRVLLWSLTLTWPFGLLIPLTTDGAGLAIYGVVEAVKVAGVIVYNITSTSFRQTYCAPGVLGRVTATMRTSSRGALALGGLLGGALGAVLGVRTGLWIAVGGAALAPVWLFLSAAVRSTRVLPARAPAPALSAPP